MPAQDCNSCPVYKANLAYLLSLCKKPHPPLIAPHRLITPAVSHACWTGCVFVHSSSRSPGVEVWIKDCFDTSPTKTAFESKCFILHYVEARSAHWSTHVQMLTKGNDEAVFCNLMPTECCWVQLLGFFICDKFTQSLQKIQPWESYASTNGCARVWLGYSSLLKSVHLLQSHFTHTCADFSPNTH